MPSILKKLKGGLRVSLGNSDSVAAQVLAQPTLLHELFSGFFSDDEIVRARTAAAVYRIAIERRQLVAPFKKKLLNEISMIEQWEVRERFCLLLPYLDLTPTEVKKTQKILYSYLNYYSSIVRTCAMQALVDLTNLDPASTSKVKKMIGECAKTGTPAMQARGRKLLRTLDKRSKFI